MTNEKKWTIIVRYVCKLPDDTIFNKHLKELCWTICVCDSNFKKMRKNKTTKF